MIIDANNIILGRLGTYAAKKALLGEKIDIVNCESCMITGDKKRVLEDYKRKFKMGTPKKGPFFYKMPDRFVKRSIRGMLPYKKERGRNAFDNIKCHIGVPENLKDQKLEALKEATIEKLPNLKYISVKEICNQMGANLK
ncbi:50S ribosomal protein L13 [Candidatus Woesearchaeota archaeon]|nr:50S ribosomal protein L13 [Candidatus Woesearchaeota archaeon]|tara:strand:- start:300 stop:719 length:420 start_codon:yes stop_codon:yes gene_type:complete